MDYIMLIYCDHQANKAAAGTNEDGPIPTLAKLFHVVLRNIKADDWFRHPWWTLLSKILVREIG